MTPTMSRRATFVAGLVVSTALLAGCSGKVEVGQVTSAKSEGATTTQPTADSAPLTVDKVRLAALAKDKLEEAAGQEAEGVECDGPIEGTVGATQRCVLTAMDGMTIGVTATVLAVTGDNFNIDFKADDHPTG